MALVFSRFSSMRTSQFRAVQFSQRVAELCEELDQSRDLVQWQCLSATVTMTTIAYLLVRGLDSLWAVALIAPLVVIGSASMQHALTLFRFYVQSHAMPALCEAFGRLRYTIGDAPDLCFHRLIEAGLLPRHDLHLIEDVFFGDHRGHQLTLALASLWRGIDDESDLNPGAPFFRAVIMAVRWSAEPANLPADRLSEIIDGQDHLKLAWSDGFLLLVIPCSASPFDLGGLFLSPEHFLRRLEQVAAMIQIPANLIDGLLDKPRPAPTLERFPV